MQIKSQDLELSVDPDRPSVFESVRDVVLPKGEATIDLTTGRTGVLPFDIQVRVHTIGKGTLRGDNFCGEFDATFYIQQPSRTARISGHFKAILA